jgi:hypothetical protein
MLVLVDLLDLYKSFKLPRSDKDTVPLGTRTIMHALRTVQELECTV